MCPRCVPAWLPVWGLSCWLRAPRVLAILSERDHLTPIKHSEKIFANIKAGGAQVQTLELDATHAFDEEDNKGMVMQFSEEAMQTSMAALLDFAAELFPAAVPAGAEINATT